MEKEHVIIRTYSAGVHMGYLTECIPGEGCYHVTLEDSRRIWSWAGAMSLSELAYHGSMLPEKCNISLPVRKIKLPAIEVIYTNTEGEKNLQNIAHWKFEK